MQPFIPAQGRSVIALDAGISMDLHELQYLSSVLMTDKPLHPCPGWACPIAPRIPDSDQPDIEGYDVPETFGLYHARLHRRCL